MERSITPYMRTRDSIRRKNSPFYGPERFTYLPESNSYRCPAGQRLKVTPSLGRIGTALFALASRHLLAVGIGVLRIALTANRVFARSSQQCLPGRLPSGPECRARVSLQRTARRKRSTSQGLRSQLGNT